MTTGYPIEIDGHEYYPIPESWIIRENAVDRNEAGDLRLYAVSAAHVGNQLRIRYASPRATSVLELERAACHGDNGVYPCKLHKSRGWCRSYSIFPPKREPDGTRRKAEYEHLMDLWADEFEEEYHWQSDDGRELIADGGRAVSALFDAKQMGLAAPEFRGGQRD